MAILTWPAYGNANAKGNNVSLTISKNLAPFVDVNSDGIYNPLAGDYPAIKGDQYLWWVFTDYGPLHNETNGLPLKTEVTAAAYAFNTQDVFGRTIFYEYNIKNLSANNYDSTVFGFFADPDLGYGFDDYVGFDSTHRAGIVYNGSSIDGSGQPNSYGASIPQCAVSLLELPGDTLGARKSAGSFIYFNNDSSKTGTPYRPSEYYNYLTGSFKDSTRLRNDWVPGVPLSTGHGAGASAQYVYPGDPSVITQWSECNSGNVPNDRRFIVSSQPFKFFAGATKKLAMSVVVVPNVGGCPAASFTDIKKAVDSVMKKYDALNTTGISAMNVVKGKLLLYPNPASTLIYIDQATSAGATEILLYDPMGRKIHADYTDNNSTIAIDIKGLNAGVYTVSYRKGDEIKYGTFVKYN